MFIPRELDVPETLMTVARDDAPVPGACLQAAAATSRQRTIAQVIAATWRLWRERTKARRELATLDAHILRDIGIARELVEYELSQPWWRPLRDWRQDRCAGRTRD